MKKVGHTVVQFALNTDHQRTSTKTIQNHRSTSHTTAKSVEGISTRENLTQQSLNKRTKYFKEWVTTLTKTSTNNLWNTSIRRKKSRPTTSNHIYWSEQTSHHNIYDSNHKTEIQFIERNLAILRFPTYRDTTCSCEYILDTNSHIYGTWNIMVFPFVFDSNGFLPTYVCIQRRIELSCQSVCIDLWNVFFNSDYVLG